MTPKQQITDAIVSSKSPICRLLLSVITFFYCPYFKQHYSIKLKYYWHRARWWHKAIHILRILRRIRSV